MKTLLTFFSSLAVSVNLESRAQFTNDLEILAGGGGAGGSAENILARVASEQLPFPLCFLFLRLYIANRRFAISHLRKILDAIRLARFLSTIGSEHVRCGGAITVQENQVGTKSQA